MLRGSLLLHTVQIIVVLLSQLNRGTFFVMLLAKRP